MAWLPISNAPLQFSNQGEPYSGAVIKFYEAGTSTVLDVATSPTGTPTVNSAVLNSEGYPTVSGNIVIIYVDQAYKIVLYPTQAAADSNTGAIWTIDGIDLSDFASIPTLLAAINSITPTDSVIIVGNGTTWVGESGNTARTSLGLGASDSPTFTNVTLSGITTGRLLVSNSAGALTAINTSVKGTIPVGDGTTTAALAVSTDDYYLACDSAASKGVSWKALPGTANDVQTFTSSGTWTKPDAARFVYVELWAAGAGGARNSSTNAAGGGSGGEYVAYLFDADDLGATESVLIPAGGAGRTGSTGDGSTGGNASFGSLLTAIGGNPGTTGNNVFASPPRFSAASISTSSSLQSAVFTQAGCGGSGSNAGTGNIGGATIYGGAGGGGAGLTAASGGISELGGNGGAGKVDGTAGGNGVVPGGGGGGANADGNGGPGAAGYARVSTW